MLQHVWSRDTLLVTCLQWHYDPGGGGGGGFIDGSVCMFTRNFPAPYGKDVAGAFLPANAINQAARILKCM